MMGKGVMKSGIVQAGEIVIELFVGDIVGLNHSSAKLLEVSTRSLLRTANADCLASTQVEPGVAYLL
jgi:hypothetical protein